MNNLKLELEHYEKKNHEFTENLLEKGLVIPEFMDIVEPDENFVSGNYIALYSLKTLIDDEPFYYSPFLVFDEKDLRYEISCASDYTCVITRLGYFDARTGKLFTDYCELETVHQYFMNHSEQYADIVKCFGSIVGDELPSPYAQICDCVVNEGCENIQKIKKYCDFLRNEGIYVPDIDLNDKSLARRFKSFFKNFDTSSEID